MVGGGGFGFVDAAPAKPALPVRFAPGRLGEVLLHTDARRHCDAACEECVMAKRRKWWEHIDKRSEPAFRRQLGRPARRLPLPRAINQDNVGDRSHLAIFVQRTSVILGLLCRAPADDGLSELLV
jgi:hypothetical protein